MNFPLRSERIELHPLTLADAPAVCRLLRDKQVLRWPTPPTSVTQASRLIARSQQRRKRRTEYLFGIRVNGQRVPIGLIGLVDVRAKSDPLPSRVPEADVVYLVDPQHQGNGYATDALKLVTDFAFQKLKLYRLNASTFPDNVRSMRVLKKAGFKPEGIRKQSRVRKHAVTDERIFGAYNAKVDR